MIPLSQILAARGVRHAIGSPGSRNAPLLVDLERSPDIDLRIVVDERSAAFIGLGLADASGRPVAIVCTSGTAPLNYGPAIAEAYYRQIPLIAVTADRPPEWIDQDDCQTIRQPGIFANFTKATFDIPVTDGSPESVAQAAALIGQALDTALASPPGPVHINIRIDLAKISCDAPAVPTSLAAALPAAAEPSLPPLQSALKTSPAPRIMILCGFMNPRNGLNDVLADLADRPNVILLCEPQSNLRVPGAVTNIDAALAQAAGAFMHPDIVITFGGSVVSRRIKEYLRGLRGLQHWFIGPRTPAPDTFRHLALHIPADEAAALKHILGQLGPCLPGQPSTPFKGAWTQAARRAMNRDRQTAQSGAWTDLAAVSHLIGNLPRGWHLQISNGTAIRLAQRCDCSRAASVACNRGVSGIDGSTSTAIGAAIATPDTQTLLITGDMSMQYDIGALATSFLPSNLKIAVLNNGGGGIFRQIDSTRSLPELQKCFVADVRLPLRQLAAAYGLDYHTADSPAALAAAYRALIASPRPALLEIRLPA